ncbi:uncharacterized protein LOC119344658 isoform X2 [Triticum dicoccoides]|uniref:uncharacterized protein LOC119344658 isoform X2 n=1 Tax=Triticum dicoccoides TaxID=85692 RepID=UPI00188E1F92|nr:uncharacterized protein LOC119344658 isoform X2 [Triticum dicoccoides]
MCVGGDCTVGVFAEAVDRRDHEAEHPVQTGYVSPLACILMCHASHFIMVVGNRVFAAGAVQYRLLSVRVKLGERGPIVYKYSWSSHSGRQREELLQHCTADSKLVTNALILLCKLMQLALTCRAPCC